MMEVLVGLAFLCSLWVFGRSFILVCYKDDCDWLALPLGLCLVGLIANTLYFMFGLTVQLIQLIFVCLLIPCLVMVFQRGINRGEWCRLAAVLGVFLLLALPGFIGGEQYYAFRGNHWDHFNYINQALTIWANPYSVYHNAAVSKFLAKDILVHGMPFLNARPAVGLVLALILPDGRGNIHLLAFLYVTALWALVFSAVCFSWKRILEAYELNKSGLLLLIAPPLAYVVGFWGQYIFDINAWSQMAAQSILLAFVFQYIRLLENLLDQAALDGKSLTSQYVVTGLLASGAFLFYPENTMLHASLLLASTVLWCAVTHKTPQFITVVSLAVFSLVVLLIASVPYWDGTVKFLISQVNSVPAGAAIFWKYFDRYWLGIHGNVLFITIKPAVVHGLSLRSFLDSYWHDIHVLPMVGYLSIFVNLILALMGMFFVSPDYSMSLCIRYVWIFITVLLAAAAIYSLAVSLFVRFRGNKKSIFLKAFFLLGILFLMYLLKIKALWTFGKALSFLSPYLFLVLCLGLIETRKRIKTDSVSRRVFCDRAIRIFTIFFIISQIGFGMYRLKAAQDPNGIGYDNLTYPSIQDTAMKTTYRWGMNPSAYIFCRGVNFDNNVFPFGSVVKRAFSDDRLDTDMIWNELIKNGYIDFNGAIQAKFNKLKNSSDMDLSEKFVAQKEQIYAILQESVFYMEYMKQKFVYLKTPYFSSLPVMSYYNQGDLVGYQSPIITDCKNVLFKENEKWETVKE